MALGERQRPKLRRPRRVMVHPHGRHRQADSASMPAHSPAGKLRPGPCLCTKLMPEAGAALATARAPAPFCDRDWPPETAADLLA